MTRIENYLNIAKRKGYQKMPPHIQIPDLILEIPKTEQLKAYYSHSFKKGTTFDSWGVAHEPGGEATFHMTKMYNPMEAFDSVEQAPAYPFPDYSKARNSEVCNR